MIIEKITNKRQVKLFHKLPFKIYKNYPAWIPHLKQDVEKCFDPKKNKAFRKGEAVRWLLLDDNKKPIGRIAAFVNDAYVREFKQPTGGIGFFEVINDKKAAFALFDVAKQWLLEKEMKAIDGPINFGEKNAFWGLLIDNFDSPPTYQINYNPPYYQTFFEEYGFQIYYNQYVFWRNLLLPAGELFVRKSKPLASDSNFTIRNIKGMSDEDIAQNFLDVYNKAWGRHAGFKPMRLANAKNIIKAMKPVRDPEITIFCYYKNEPIAFYINLPELNEIFRYVNGNLNVWGKIKFLYHKWKKTPTTMYSIVFGVVPEWQGKGVESAMIQYTETELAHLGKYNEVVLTWIGDFNIKMLKVCTNLDATIHRTLATYRLMLDNATPFERAPFIGGKLEDLHRILKDAKMRKQN